MASVQELEKAMRDASAAGNFSDAQVFYEELVKLKPETRMPRASDQFEYRTPTGEDDFSAIVFPFTVAVLVVAGVVGTGWGKWKLRFARARAGLCSVSLESVWIVSKCALAIATTVLILNLIHDRPWLWFLRH